MLKKNKLFLIIFIFFFSSNALANINNKILITVDNQIITSIDLINEIKLINIITDGKLSKLKKKEIKNHSLKSLINRLIKKNELKKHDLHEVGNDELNNKIEKITQKMKISNIDLKKIFKNNNVPFQLLRERLTIETKWNYLIFKLYKDKISLNEDEVEKQLQEAKKKQNLYEYNVSEILLESINADILNEKLNEISKHIEENSFEKTAFKFSKSSSATNNGNLGWLKETEISVKVKKAIQPLAVGTVSKPIYLPEGILLIKLNNKRKIKNELSEEQLRKIILTKETNKKLDFYSILHFQKIKNITSIEFK